MADRDLSSCAGRECCISASVHWPQDPLMSSPSWRRVLKTCARNQISTFPKAQLFLISSSARNGPRGGEWAAEPPCDALEISSPLAGRPVRCVLCARTLRNVLGTLFSTQAVWPHAKRRQHSSCYRSASVRVVMVAAPKSRYLPSERRKKIAIHREARRTHDTRTRRGASGVGPQGLHLDAFGLISLHAHEWAKQVDLYHRPDHGVTAATLVGKYWLRMTPHGAAK